MTTGVVWTRLYDPFPGHQNQFKFCMEAFNCSVLMWRKENPAQVLTGMHQLHISRPHHHREGGRLHSDRAALHFPGSLRLRSQQKAQEAQPWHDQCVVIYKAKYQGQISAFACI
ncbi:hypothetical protein FQN60_010698 [Etheostoma spectabile]|uniref:Uncharacterized protein n=1 Tax=Etheostoma spectabile TaxID=54343 RepID=A0A5J5CCW9_9PERO|nr:hypothetical protein FQN60_010698 [Etheostoma spectabile]